MLEERVLISDANSGEKMYEATLDYDLSGNVEMKNPLYFRSGAIRELKFLGHCFFSAPEKLSIFVGSHLLAGCRVSQKDICAVVKQAAIVMNRCYGRARLILLKGDGKPVNEDFNDYFYESSRIRFVGRNEMLNQFKTAVKSNSVTVSLLENILMTTVVKEAV